MPGTAHRLGSVLAALSSVVVVLAGLLLAGCDFPDAGGYVGGEGSITDASASVSADRLCEWHHHTADDHASMSVSCSSSRQVYTTCDIELWQTFGGGPRSDRTHGQQHCSANVNTGIDIYGPAIGSIGTIWMRLDNPDRVWRQKFRSGSPIDCSIYENSNSQSIMECGHVHGSPSINGRLRERSRQALTTLTGYSGPAKGKVLRACARKSPLARPGLKASRRCARAARRALAQLTPHQRRHLKRQLRG